MTRQDDVTYDSPGMIDVLTMAQGILEQRIAGAAMVDRERVLAEAGNFTPEINVVVCRIWPILLENADYFDFMREPRKAGLSKEDNQELITIAAFYVSPVDLARNSLHQWKACKAGRLGLQALAEDPTIIQEIIKKSRFKDARR